MCENFFAEVKIDEFLEEHEKYGAVENVDALLEHIITESVKKEDYDMMKKLFESKYKEKKESLFFSTLVQKCNLSRINLDFYEKIYSLLSENVKLTLFYLFLYSDFDNDNEEFISKNIDLFRVFPKRNVLLNMGIDIKENTLKKMIEKNMIKENVFHFLLFMCNGFLPENKFRMIFEEIKTLNFFNFNEKQEIYFMNCLLNVDLKIETPYDLFEEYVNYVFNNVLKHVQSYSDEWFINTIKIYSVTPKNERYFILKKIIKDKNLFTQEIISKSLKKIANIMTIKMLNFIKEFGVENNIDVDMHVNDDFILTSSVTNENDEIFEYLMNDESFTKKFVKTNKINKVVKIFGTDKMKEIYTKI